jgi:hypothetical protein
MVPMEKLGLRRPGRVESRAAGDGAQGPADIAGFAEFLPECAAAPGIKARRVGN